MSATPAVRPRLLAAAMIVFAAAVLPPSVGAQQNAGGSVRLVIRAHDLLPLGLVADSQAILWMAPASMEETERLAAVWAVGDDDEALKAWRSVVETEVEAQRLATPEQVNAAASWIAARAVSIASGGIRDGPGRPPDRREREIRWAARGAAMSFINGSARLVWSEAMRRVPDLVGAE